MTSAWSGSIAQLKKIADSGTYILDISLGFEKAFYAPTAAEVNSWKNSIPELLNAMKDPKYDLLQIILELRMPVGADRADVILLGGDSKNPKAMIIELKQWSNVELNTTTLEVNVPRLGTHQHPSLQALNYAGKLKFFNSRAHNYELRAIVFCPNANERDVEELTSQVPHSWIRDAPVYSERDMNSLASYIEEFLLPCSLVPDENLYFSQAPYQQSQHLFSFLQKHAQDIAKNAEVAIASSGMGLTAEQAKLKNEILNTVAVGEKKDFIVQGGPGSGKTLLAVSLLLNATGRGFSCILALRNNRLQTILRQIFDNSCPGVSGLLMYFEPRQGKGIAQYEGKVDLLICDEAQRMESRIMSSVLQKATTCAIFLDETQRLNPPEEGTISNFSRSSLSVDRTPVTRKLNTLIRGFGGQAYYEWVEELLTNPSNRSRLQISAQEFHSRYLLGICSSIEELISKLIQCRSPSARVALVASFTESPGNINRADHPENLRIGYPLSSGFTLYQRSHFSIPWLMSPSDYKQFWIGGRSNRLDRVASIYGTQGFESDYVGVIWGRDLLYRNEQWKLGDPDICFDKIDRLVIRRKGNNEWSSEALNLLINRYRIFLTRGIKGTLIFCEDEETRDYLLELQ